MVSWWCRRLTEVLFPFLPLPSPSAFLSFLFSCNPQFLRLLRSHTPSPPVIYSGLSSHESDNADTMRRALQICGGSAAILLYRAPKRERARSFFGDREAKRAAAAAAEDEVYSGIVPAHVFRELNAHLTPELSAKVKACFRFDIVDDGSVSEQWTLDLKSKHGSMRQSVEGAPSVGCTLTMARRTVCKWLNDDMNVLAAFARGDIKIAGNLLLPQRLRYIQCAINAALNVVRLHETVPLHKTPNHRQQSDSSGGNTKTSTPNHSPHASPARPSSKKKAASSPLSKTPSRTPSRGKDPASTSNRGRHGNGTDVEDLGGALSGLPPTLENESDGNNADGAGAAVEPAAAQVASSTRAAGDSAAPDYVSYEEIFARLGGKLTSDMVAEIGAVFQLRVTFGEDPSRCAVWTLDLKSASGDVYEGECKGHVDTTVTLSDATMIGWVNQTIDPLTAFMSGLLVVEGDQTQILKLGTMQSAVEACRKSLIAQRHRTHEVLRTKHFSTLDPFGFRVPLEQLANYTAAAEAEEVTKRYGQRGQHYSGGEMHMNAANNAAAAAAVTTATTAVVAESVGGATTGSTAKSISRKVKTKKKKSQQAVDEKLVSDFTANIWATVVDYDARPELWAACQRVCTARLSSSDTLSYDALVAQTDSLVSDIEKDQVDKDVPRTFLSHPRFADDGDCAQDMSLLPKLQRILLACLAREESQGYWQGMAFVAGFALLLYPDNERQAFLTTTFLFDWVLAGLFGSQGPARKTQELDEVIRTKVPALWSKFEGLGIPSCVFSTSWLVCSFTADLPSTAVARIWDMLFLSTAAHVIHNDRADGSTRATQELKNSLPGLDILALFTVAILKVNLRQMLRYRDAQELHDGIKGCLAGLYDPLPVLNAAYAEITTVASGRPDALVECRTDPWDPGFPWSAFMETIRYELSRPKELQTYAIGARLMVTGLKVATEVNGQYGVCNGFLASGKYEILLDSGRAVRLAPMNVVLVLASPSADAAAIEDGDGDSGRVSPSLAASSTVANGEGSSGHRNNLVGDVVEIGTNGTINRHNDNPEVSSIEMLHSIIREQGKRIDAQQTTIETLLHRVTALERSVLLN